MGLGFTSTSRENHCYEECIKFDIPYDNNSAKKLKKIRHSENASSYPDMNFAGFRKLSAAQQAQKAVVLRAESQRYQWKNCVCPKCKRCRLNMTLHSKGPKKGLCTRANDEKFWEENDALPVWYEVEPTINLPVDSEGKTLILYKLTSTGERIVHYELPEELVGLRLAERMMIQMVGPITPVVHLQYGVYGSKGHCCTYSRDIGPMCRVLPRLPSRIEMIKVVRAFKNRRGQEDCQIFTVRRHKILQALQWLKRHNHCYKDIEISVDNLSWMQGKDSCVLDVPTIDKEEDMIHSNFEDNVQNMQQPGIPDNVFEHCGAVCEGNDSEQVEFNGYDKVLYETLLKSSKENCSNATMLWPEIGKAISEYKTAFFFTMAYPWLFPGGFGDLNNRDR
ncbi:MAG: DUF6570 domain-containing protein, partial [Gaiellaceae bacterium]